MEWGVGQAPVSLTQPACVYVGVPARPLTSGELKFPHSKMCGLSCVYNFPGFRGALGGGGSAFAEENLPVSGAYFGRRVKMQLGCRLFWSCLLASGLEAVFFSLAVLLDAC